MIPFATAACAFSKRGAAARAVTKQCLRSRWSYALARKQKVREAKAERSAARKRAISPTETGRGGGMKRYGPPFDKSTVAVTRVGPADVAKGGVALAPNRVRRGRHEILRIMDGGRPLLVYVDGALEEFDPLFLRDSCQCAACVDPYSGQKNFSTFDLSSKLEYAYYPTQLPDGTIKVLWNTDLPGWPSDHKSVFPPEFFRLNSSRDERNPQLSVKPWTEDVMRTLSRRNFYYGDFMDSLDTFGHAMRRLCRYGLVIIKGVPKDETAIERIAEKIGPLKHTFYGRTWDVKDKPQAENVAYTSGHLGLHMDLLYLKNPPGLQLLHCLQTSDVGGESIFSDGLHAASVVEAISPEAFGDLATFPVTYEYKRGGHHYTDTKPVFEMDPYHAAGSPGPSSRLSDILNINWSPPFQGKLKVNIGQGDHGRALQNWVRAAKAFDTALNEPRALFSYRMEEGDCVIFNNRRVLHGRTAFSSTPAVDIYAESDAAAAMQRTETRAPLAAQVRNKVRWLKGAYVDMDDFHSKARMAGQWGPAGESTVAEDADDREAERRAWEAESKEESEEESREESKEGSSGRYKGSSRGVSQGHWTR